MQRVKANAIYFLHRTWKTVGIKQMFGKTCPSKSINGQSIDFMIDLFITQALTITVHRTFV